MDDFFKSRGLVTFASHKMNCSKGPWFSAPFTRSLYDSYPQSQPEPDSGKGKDGLKQRDFFVQTPEGAGLCQTPVSSSSI